MSNENICKMMLPKLFFLYVFIALSVGQTTEPNTISVVTPSQNDVQPITTENNLIKWNKYTITATIIAVVLVVVGIYAMVALIMPLVTYKLCYLFGYCPYSLPTYVDEYLQTQGYPRQKRSADYLDLLMDTLGKAYEKYGEYLLPDNTNGREKRQADYLSPLLQTLAMAYEKYQEGNPKKNFKIGTSYTK